MADLSRAVWRKSTRSGNGGNCVEVATNMADTDGVILVRDSKNPSGPHLTFSRAEWTAFLGGVEGHEFDL